MRRALPLLAAALARASADDKCCWCDGDTPGAERTTTGSDGKTYKLVFSDEFNGAGRQFANGADARWTALEVGDTSNKGAAFYLPEQAEIVHDPKFTDVSALRIRTENSSFVGDSPTGETGIHMPFRSAMLQSWNKFCFTGGVVEFRARLPRGGGYWPALWTFGNLGRAVYQDSNTGLWPWSYDQCDADLELPPTDPPQRISACDDHDLERDGLHAFQGRGATELDVIEGAVSNTGKGSYVVGSVQLSPGIPPCAPTPRAFTCHLPPYAPWHCSAIARATPQPLPRVTDTSARHFSASPPSLGPAVGTKVSSSARTDRRTTDGARPLYWHQSLSVASAAAVVATPLRTPSSSPDSKLAGTALHGVTLAPPAARTRCLEASSSAPTSTPGELGD